jgi:hypothetical protein
MFIRRQRLFARNATRQLFRPLGSIRSTSPVSVSSKYSTRSLVGFSAWTHRADVWIRWKAKPGRRLYYAAPTLICRAELLADLKRTRERHRKRPRLEDIAHDEAMLAALEVSPHAADDYDPPSVYTRAIGINRSETEQMLAFLLERRHGIKNP